MNIQSRCTELVMLKMSGTWKLSCSVAAYAWANVVLVVYVFC